MTIPMSGARPRQPSAPKSNLSILPGGGGYTGASGSKRALRTWWPLARSADEDTVPDLRTLRGRSRDLVRNAPIAGGAINTVTTSVVGTGLRLQSAIDRELLGLDEVAAKEWQNRAERLWRHWCCRCDIRRRRHFDQIQDSVLRSQLESGDVLVIRRNRPRPGDLLGLKLQLVEADRIGTPPEHSQNPRIIDGVQINADGAPVSYWVSNRHPSSLGTVQDVVKWSQVMALGTQSRRRQVLHIADLMRPEQTRGVPYLAPVIEPLKQLERYTEAELAAAVVASFFTVFTKTEGAEGLANETSDPNAIDSGTINSPTRDLELGTGAVVDLEPGEDITIADPKRPNANFDPFVMAVITQIGMRLEVPFEVLTKHFKASYSASRAALLEAWRFFKKRRHWLSLDLNAPIYEWVIEEAVLRGYLDAPGFDSDPLIRQAWLRAIWIGNAQGHVDPTKEVAAFQAMKTEGWISDSEATQEVRGQDFDEVVSRRSSDQRTLDAADLTPEAPEPATPPDDPDDDEQNPDVPEGEDES